MEFDKTDREILALLQVDARLSYRDIAKRLGVSHTKVSSRIRELEKNGVIIGYTAVVNPESVSDYPLCIRISAGPGVNLGEIGREVAQINSVDIVLRVSGDCELLALALCNDKGEALQVLSEVNMVTGVAKAESHIVLDAIKMYGLQLK